MEVSRRGDGKLELTLDGDEMDLVEESLRGFLEDQPGALPGKTEGSLIVARMLDDIEAARQRR